MLSSNHDNKILCLIINNIAYKINCGSDFSIFLKKNYKYILKMIIIIVDQILVLKYYLEIKNYILILKSKKNIFKD